MNQYVRLGVNIDHVATLRNARGGHDPHLLQMALAVGKQAPMESQFTCVRIVVI